MIQALVATIPEHIRHKSGRIFYSGRDAFSSQSPLYLLGSNPAGDLQTHKSDTVESHTAVVLRTFPADWSAYRDESWRGFRPGTARLQTRVLHMLKGLGLNPGLVPSSNLIFVRSRRLDGIAQEFEALADVCWNFHATVIERLKPRAVVCFGRKAGVYVCRKVGANKLHAEFVEENERRWRSQTFVSSANLKVVIVTHPSIVDWTAAKTDPTQLVREALN